ncbi:Ies4p [Saccharomyces paradoxus]|uniref:Ies4p n=1 Tax=Saccharomyces paradoxus TaxID=27291 RepID=A0A8B8UZY2_SACPA|nr:Ies4 [Saccharomyces paradoxus]QHS76287.1 Ies4 [Saccharomyces paradoxus]
MSQESSVLSESQEQLGNNPKIEDTSSASANPRDNSKPVLPWDYKDKAIEIKSFSGYKVNFTGWIRRDVREKRQNQAVDTTSDIKESDDKSTGKKEPADEDPEGKEFEEEREDRLES